MDPSEIGVADLAITRSLRVAGIDFGIAGGKLFGAGIEIERLSRAIELFIGSGDVVGSRDPGVANLEVVRLPAQEPVIDIEAAAIGIESLLPVSPVPLQIAETAGTAGQASLAGRVLRLLLEELPGLVEGLAVVEASQVAAPLAGLQIGQIDQGGLERLLGARVGRAGAGQAAKGGNRFGVHCLFGPLVALDADQPPLVLQRPAGS